MIFEWDGVEEHLAKSSDIYTDQIFKEIISNPQSLNRDTFESHLLIKLVKTHIQIPTIMYKLMVCT